MDDTAPTESVGHRLAVARKLAGFTQQQLAGRINFSLSLIGQVERGVTPASPALTAAAARALRIDVEALTGQPYGAAITHPQADHAGIPALRIALDYAEDPVLTGPPMSPAELRQRLDDCHRDQQRSRHSQMVAELPELLQHASVLAAEARPASEAADTAWALLDDAYELAAAVSYSFGYFDLTALTCDRRRYAAVRSGDPLRAAEATGFGGVCVRLVRGDYAGVVRVVERAQSDIAEQRSPAAQAVRAQLHLRAAIAHARGGAGDRADEHIAAARELVIELGVPPHPYYAVIATPGNVECHWVAAPVELADGTTAVDRATRVHIPETEQPSRVGHHWIDVARAWTLHGDRTKALDALNRARRITPQQTRYHPSVHETVQLLAETDRRATDSLAGFARWASIPL